MPVDFRSFNAEQLRNDPRFGSIYGRFGGQPSWTWRIAGFVALLVFVVPIVVLTLAALLAFLIVFAVLSVAARIGSAIGSVFNSPSRDVKRYDPAPTDDPEGDGARVNVRVIRYD